MTQISVRLDEADLVALDRLCEQFGETRSRVIGRGIALLAQQKLPSATSHELAARLGLIGAFRGRIDLSDSVSTQVKRKLCGDAARR